MSVWAGKGKASFTTTPLARLGSNPETVSCEADTQTTTLAFPHFGLWPNKNRLRELVVVIAAVMCSKEQPAVCARRRYH